MTALAAAQQQEPAGHDAAILKGIEFVLHERGQLGAGAGRGLLQGSVQRDLIGAVAFAANRGAIGSPQGLLPRGSHDGLPAG